MIPSEGWSKTEDLSKLLNYQEMSLDLLCRVLAHDLINRANGASAYIQTAIEELNDKDKSTVIDELNIAQQSITDILEICDAISEYATLHENKHNPENPD